MYFFKILLVCLMITPVFSAEKDPMEEMIDEHSIWGIFTSLFVSDDAERNESAGSLHKSLSFLNTYKENPAAFFNDVHKAVNIGTHKGQYVLNVMGIPFTPTEVLGTIGIMRMVYERDVDSLVALLLFCGTSLTTHHPAPAISAMASTVAYAILIKSTFGLEFS